MTVQDAKSGPTVDRVRKGKEGVPLRDAVRAESGPGPLSPMWVEWLMGFPIGVDRLTGLGNAVVPQCSEVIGRMLVDLRTK